MSNYFIIQPLTSNEEPPYNLMELADPSRKLIHKYLNSGNCYVAKLHNQIIGVVVLVKKNSTTIEIKNLAIQPDKQGKGYGKKLLLFAEQETKKEGFKKLIIGTGNSSILQLKLYQKAGFEIHKIKKDFFLNNYKAPIFENEIQCKHLIVLVKKI